MKTGSFKEVREKLGFKIFLSFMIIMFLVSSCFTGFFIHNQREALEDALMKKGKLLSTILARNSRIGVFSENAELLKDPVEGVLAQKEVLAVSVFNLDRQQLLERGGSAAIEHESSEETGQISPDKIFAQLRTTQLPISFKYEDKFEFWAPVLSSSAYSSDESLFFEENILNNNNRLIGFVRITIDREIHNKQLNTLLIKGLLIGLIFVLAGTAAMYFLVLGITKPLKKLTQTVKAFGEEGEFQELNIATEDEIGRLAKTFNNMAASLQKREDEKKLLAEKLNHANKMEAIGTMAGGIAHDFNNILAAILLNIEAALEDSDENEEDNEYVYSLKQVLKLCYRARSLVSQILTFSRDAKIERNPLRSVEIVKESVKMIRPIIPSTVEMKTDIADDAGTILGDPVQIQQLLLNLCTNAGHAMGEKGGVIDVILGNVYIKEADLKIGLQPGAYIELKVKDTGGGIDPDIMDRIFDPFFTTKDIGVGTGLGLSVVHGIITNHEGVMSIDNKPGQGAEFRIFLPRIDDIAKEPEFKSKTLVKGKGRILFVDDEEDIIDVGCRMIGNLGYDIVAARSGAEALEMFRDTPEGFDLVITDMTMPRMTGIDLAENLLKLRSDIPIIICTGYNQYVSPERAKTIGIREYLKKPYNAGELAEKIYNAMNAGLNPPREANH